MRKPSERDMKLLEKYYDVYGDGVSALRLEKALSFPRFKIAVRKLYDANLVETSKTHNKRKK
ncbi:hypothetical protein [Microbulbifer thermotolerans]|nr:hypothetical protein [Microbulbifer thermotolerans]MCX2832930.1 hypothetical protein [Microbulbifer thermotolerans]